MSTQRSPSSRCEAVVSQDTQHQRSPLAAHNTTISSSMFSGNDLSSSRSPNLAGSGGTGSLELLVSSAAAVAAAAAAAAANQGATGLSSANLNIFNIGNNGLPSISAITKQISKLKRFLSTILSFGKEIDASTGELVKNIIFSLLCNRISIEQFQSKLQQATHFPLKTFVTPFLKATLPLLQQELILCSQLVHQTPENFLAHNKEYLYPATDVLQQQPIQQQTQPKGNGEILSRITESSKLFCFDAFNNGRDFSDHNQEQAQLRSPTIENGNDNNTASFLLNRRLGAKNNLKRPLSVKVDSERILETVAKRPGYSSNAAESVVAAAAGVKLASTGILCSKPSLVSVANGGGINSNGGGGGGSSSSHSNNCGYGPGGSNESGGQAHSLLIPGSSSIGSANTSLHGVPLGGMPLAAVAAAAAAAAAASSQTHSVFGAGTTNSTCGGVGAGAGASASSSCGAATAASVLSSTSATNNNNNNNNNNNINNNNINSCSSSSYFDLSSSSCSNAIAAAAVAAAATPTVATNTSRQSILSSSSSSSLVDKLHKQWDQILSHITNFQSNPLAVNNRQNFNPFFSLEYEILSTVDDIIKSQEDHYKTIMYQLKLLQENVRRSRDESKLSEFLHGSASTNLIDFSGMKRHSAKYYEEAFQEVQKVAQTELRRTVRSLQEKTLELVDQERSKFYVMLEEVKRQSKEEYNTLFHKQEDGPENCQNCGRRATEACSGCHGTRYCGRFCQQHDWPKHQLECTGMAMVALTTASTASVNNNSHVVVSSDRGTNGSSHSSATVNTCKKLHIDLHSENSSNSSKSPNQNDPENLSLKLSFIPSAPSITGTTLRDEVVHNVNSTQSTTVITSVVNNTNSTTNNNTTSNSTSTISSINSQSVSEKDTLLVCLKKEKNKDEMFLVDV